MLGRIVSHIIKMKEKLYLYLHFFLIKFNHAEKSHILSYKNGNFVWSDTLFIGYTLKAQHILW